MRKGSERLTPRANRNAIAHYSHSIRATFGRLFSLAGKWWKTRKKHGFQITIKITPLRIVLFFFLLFAVWPSHGNSVAAPESQPPISKPKLVAHIAPPRVKKLKTVTYTAPHTNTSYTQSTKLVTVTGNAARDILIQRESGGNPLATNYLGCFGLLQACPGYPLRVACGGNVACQLDWFTKNKLGRYGSWEAALQHSYNFGWW